MVVMFNCIWQGQKIVEQQINQIAEGKTTLLQLEKGYFNRYLVMWTEIPFRRKAFNSWK